MLWSAISHDVSVHSNQPQGKKPVLIILLSLSTNLGLMFTSQFQPASIMLLLQKLWLATTCSCFILLPFIFQEELWSYLFWGIFLHITETEMTSLWSFCYFKLKVPWIHLQGGCICLRHIFRKIVHACGSSWVDGLNVSSIATHSQCIWWIITFSQTVAKPQDSKSYNSICERMRWVSKMKCKEQFSNPKQRLPA